MKWVKRFFAGWVLWRLFGPEEAPRFPVGQEHPLRISGRTVFVGDREFLVREAGPSDGPKLMLIHGLGDTSVMVWSQIAPHLMERYRLAIIDLRNHGKSDWIRGRFELQELGDDVAGIMTAIGWDRADVFGYSFGGLVAQQLAGRHPHRVRRLILGGTTAYVDKTRAQWSRLVFLFARAWERLSPLEFATIRWRYLVGVGAIPPSHQRWLWNAQLARDIDLYYQAWFAAVRYDARDLVAKLRQPVLSIIPTSDQIVPAATQYDLAARLQDVEVLEVPRARHEVVFTHAELVANTVDAFLTVDGAAQRPDEPVMGSISQRGSTKA